MTTRILLAEDHQIVREGIVALLGEHEGLEVVAQAKNGKEAVDKALEVVPDLVVMDINMPELDGIAATRRIVSAHKNIKIIALSMHSEKKLVLEMFRAGARGFLLKFSATEELIRAIEEVQAGKMFLSPGIAGVVMEDFILDSRIAMDPAHNLLTEREKEVLAHIAEGLTTKEIAVKLNLSVKTVGTHRENVMKKLDIHNVAELTKYALREGLTDLLS